MAEIAAKVTSFLVDSTLHIQWGRGHSGAAAWLEGHASDDLVTSVISITEVFTGVSPATEPRWSQYFARFRTAGVDERVARIAGGLRFRLARQGQHLSLPDGLIAAQALLNDWTVVTANVRDFAQTGVQLIAVA